MLSSAKSKDRKELIKTAINKLESNSIGGNEDRFDFDSHPLSTTMSAGNLNHASLFAPHSELSVTASHSLKQQMMRPMSARRRPSTPSLLDAIPEVLIVIMLGISIVSYPRLSTYLLKRFHVA